MSAAELVWEGEHKNLNIKVLSCSFIEREKVDIIVNTVSTSLDLNGRKLSAVLSSEAGPALQEALNVLRQEEQVVGSVISTDGFRLKCKKIYHIVTPGFDREVSEQVIENSVLNCLLMGERARRRSIAIPAVGTGGLGFPPEVVAHRMLNAVLRFQQEVGVVQHLVDIRFALIDPHVREAFVQNINEIAEIDERGKYRIPFPIQHTAPAMHAPGVENEKVSATIHTPIPDFHQTTLMRLFADVSEERKRAFCRSFIPWRWTSTSRAPPIHRNSEWLDLLMEYLFLEERRSPVLIHGSKFVGKTTFLSLIEERWLSGRLPIKWVYRISGSEVMECNELKTLLIGQLESRGLTRQEVIDLLQVHGEDMLVLIDDCEYVPDSFLSQIQKPDMSALQYVLAVRSPCVERISSELTPSDMVKLHKFSPMEVERYCKLYQSENPEAHDIWGTSPDIKLYNKPGYIQYASSFPDSSLYLDSEGSKTKLTSAWLKKKLVSNTIEKFSQRSWHDLLSERGKVIGKELFDYIARGRPPSNLTAQTVTSAQGHLLKDIVDYSIALFLVDMVNKSGNLDELTDIGLCYKIQASLALTCGLSKSAAYMVQVRLFHLANISREIQAARESIWACQDDRGIQHLGLLARLQSESLLESKVHEMNEESGPQVPLEVKHMGPEYTLAYQKACKEGCKQNFQTRIMLVGHFGAGKTSLKRSLLSQPFVSEYLMTNSIDADPSSCKIFINETDNWNLQVNEKDDTYEKEIAKLLHKLYNRLTLGQAKTLPIPETGSRVREVQPNIPGMIDEPDEISGRPGILSMNDPPNAGNHIHEQEPDEPSGPDYSNLENLEDPLQAEIPPTVLEEFAALVEAARNQHKDKPEFKFSIWDFAGQAVFYTTHQTFLTHRAIYLLVLDVTQSLQTRITTHRQGRHEKLVDETCPQEVADYLDYWLNCIHTHAMPKEFNPKSTTLAPPVVVVLTHKDVLLEKYPSTAEEIIKQYYKSLNKFIEKKVYADHVHLTKYCVSNKNSQDPDIRDLRKKVVDIAQQQVYWGEQIPLRWIALKERLQTLKNLSNVTALDRVKEEASEAGIADQEELITALRFYHELGDIVFFNEPDLREFIILDPQWLIDCFKQVITIPKFHEQHQFPRSQLHWKNLEECGVLHEDILDAVWDSGVKQQLVTLMYKFRLLLPIPSQYMKRLSSAEELEEVHGQCYLVPCLLPPLKSKPSDVHQTHLIPSVLIAFRHSFIPVGVLSRLFSSLVKDEGWQVAGFIFHDYASFVPDDSNIRLNILKKNDTLEVSAYDLEENCAAIRPQCLQTYFHVIVRHVEDILRTVSPTVCFVLKVWCQCPGVQKALVHVGPRGELMEIAPRLFCNYHWRKFSTKSFSPWFNVAPEPKKMAVRGFNVFPTDLDLQILADNVGMEWHSVSLHLGLSDIQTQQARMNFPCNIVSCTFSLLRTWRNSSPENEQGKINSLKEALGKCGRNDLIENYVSKWSQGGPAA